MTGLIAYAHAQHACGRIQIGVTERGIASVTINDELHVSQPDASAARWISRVIAVLDGAEDGASLTRDVSGTPFQQRVWEALLRIPYGSTASYADIAREIGQPNASRAVGTACGANPVAIIVPCHRVVATGVGMGGFAWGIEVKKKLLAWERQQLTALKRAA